MQWDAIPFLGIVFVALMLLPLWMLISGIRHKGRIRMMVGGACFVVVFAFGVFLVDSFCSRHERILDHGTTRLQGKTLPHDCGAGGLRPAAASERSR